ncbi:LuxR C-terminal-related transcriptional regulator [Leucobacter sp. HY1908]
MQQIRVAIVNDYEVVVRGLASMLRAYQNVVQVVEIDLNNQVRDPVDITLFDTFAATHSGWQPVRELSLNPLAGKIAVFSWAVDPTYIQAALAHGATSYISKGIPARQLVAALEEIHAEGKQVYAAGDGATTSLAGDWPGREEGLTQREAEVLALITQGLSNVEIANQVHLSINSIKTHVRSCYRRINVTSRTNAVLWGIAHGLGPNQARIKYPRPELDTGDAEPGT